MGHRKASNGGPLRYTPCLYCHRRPSTKVVRSKPACQQCWTTAKREKRAAKSAKAAQAVGQHGGGV